jgi:hypothetical protein
MPSTQLAEGRGWGVRGHRERVRSKGQGFTMPEKRLSCDRLLRTRTREEARRSWPRSVGRRLRRQTSPRQRSRAVEAPHPEFSTTLPTNGEGVAGEQRACPWVQVRLEGAPHKRVTVLVVVLVPRGCNATCPVSGTHTLAWHTHTTPAMGHESKLGGLGGRSCVDKGCGCGWGRGRQRGHDVHTAPSLPHCQWS